MLTRTAVIAASCFLTTASFAAPRMFEFDASLRNGRAFPSLNVTIDGQTFFPSNIDAMPEFLDASAASQDFAFTNPTVSGRFSYDTDADPTGVFSNFTNYRGTGFELDVALPGGGSFTVSKSDPVVTITNDGSSGDRIGISTSFEALDNPFVLPNSPSEFDTTSIDLLSDANIAMNAPDLPALDNLWVRLTPPSEIDFQIMSLNFRDSTGTALDSTDLPGSIDLADFTTSDPIIIFQFESLRGFEVIREDYDSDADFQLASDWVDQYLEQVEVVDVLNFNIETLVPAPGAGALLAGAGLLAFRRRR